MRALLSSDPETGRGESERVWIGLLAAVLVVGFGVRLWLNLTLPRYFDDHYVLNNIRLYLNGSLRPRHSYYGSLSYLPQAFALGICEFLYSLTGLDVFSVHGSYAEGFTLVAFRITRMFVLAYSLLSVVMIYHVGRRLFSPAVGGIAAAVLAAYPQHLRSSTQLKPDMLALLFTLVTLYWTAAAVRDPRRSRFLLAGVGVGLATASKYTGIGSCLPLTAWALWTGFRDRRRWGWLVLSGLTAVATFFALNPFLGTVLRFVPRLIHFYGDRAHDAHTDQWTVLRREIEFLATQHDWLLGALLLLGTALLARRLWRGPDRERAAALLPLALYLGHSAIHAAGVSFFRSQNMLPALAGTALVCAFAIERCGRWLLSRVPAKPGVVFLAGLIPAGLLLAAQLDYAYERIVPVTWSVAERTLRARINPLRAGEVACEPANARIGLADGWQSAVETAVPSLAALPPSLLDFTDAEVFPLSRSDGPEAAFYRGRQQRRGQTVLQVRPRLFRLRGTPLVVLLHPWRPAGPAVRLDLARAVRSPNVLLGRLPDAAPGDVFSIELVRPVKERFTTVVVLQPGDRVLPLRLAGRLKGQLRFLTQRFPYAAGQVRLRVPVAPQSDPGAFRLRLWRWTPNPPAR